MPVEHFVILVAHYVGAIAANGCPQGSRGFRLRDQNNLGQTEFMSTDRFCAIVRLIRKIAEGKGKPGHLGGNTVLDDDTHKVRVLVTRDNMMYITTTKGDGKGPERRWAISSAGTSQLMHEARKARFRWVKSTNKGPMLYEC